MTAKAEAEAEAEAARLKSDATRATAILRLS